MTCEQGLLRLLWGGPEVGVLRHCVTEIQSTCIYLIQIEFSQVYFYPNSMIFKLTRIALNFVTPKSSSLTTFELSKTREIGGYDILDISLYLQLLYTQQLNQYYLYKTERYDRLPHLLLMEHNAGKLCSSKLDLKISNTKPHLLEQSYFYKQFLQVMNKCDIGKNEIQTMKLRQMYYWIVKKEKSQIFIPSINFSILKRGDRFIMTYSRII